MRKKYFEWWLPIKGYEGLYEVSNLGRVRSVDRTVIAKNGRLMHLKGTILKNCTYENYNLVRLSKNGEGSKKFVHKLVAEAFLPNPENKKEVDHLIPVNDGGTDEVFNLKWCTHEENMNNPISKLKQENRCGDKNPMFGKHHTEVAKKKMSEARKGKKFNMPLNNAGSKKVYQYTLEGELVKIWPSVAECKRNGFDNGTISKCCNGKEKTHKGYIWSYIPL